MYLAGEFAIKETIIVIFEQVCIISRLRSVVLSLRIVSIEMASMAIYTLKP